MAPGVHQLKILLENINTDEELNNFLNGYAIGFAADQFISIMNFPGQRAQFLAAIAKTYPEDWKLAVEQLSKG